MILVALDVVRGEKRPTSTDLRLSIRGALSSTGESVTVK